MPDDREYDSSTFVEETGASTGDARLNDPAAAGFTDADDRVFRSHFQQVNRLADVGYARMRPAYRLGFEAAASDAGSFEQIEKQLANGWLSVRVGGGDWASVRELARAGADRSSELFGSARRRRRSHLARQPGADRERTARLSAGRASVRKWDRGSQGRTPCSRARRSACVQLVDAQ